MRMFLLVFVFCSFAKFESKRFTNETKPYATCSFSEGQDCFGNDITHSPSSTTQSCCDLCSQNSQCKAFTWSKYDTTGAPNPICYMKSSCDSMQPKSTCTAGKLGGAPTPAPPPTPVPPPTPKPSYITPSEMVKLMGVGINLGNTLDAPHEGDWAPAARQSYFDAYKSKGFKHVRIPICWDKHTGTSSPYSVDGNFMNRVEEVVGWSLARNFITVINTHHEDWLDNQGNFYNELPRLKAIWTQIADRFKDHHETLLFEIFNEPHVINADMLNAMNSAVLPIIRATNPTRIVLYGGLAWMNPHWIIDNPDSMKLPNDPQVMLEVHSYDPYDYTKPSPTVHSWGSQSDIDAINGWTRSLHTWGLQHNISVLLGEFGCTHDQNDGTGRKKWYAQIRESVLSNDFALSVWDDNGDYQVYHRDNGQWDESVLSALLG